MSLTGDYKITGRDSLVFLVDASKEMFIKGEDGQPSNFDMTMQVKYPLVNVPLCVYVLLSVGVTTQNNWKLTYWDI